MISSAAPLLAGPIAAGPDVDLRTDHPVLQASTAGVPEDGAATTRLGPRTLALFVGTFGLGAAPVLAIITSLWLFPTDFPLELHILLGGFALAFPFVVQRLEIPRTVQFLRFFALAGLALALVSFVTGGGNGLTDEPYTTPRYVGLLVLGQNPYAVPLVFQYTEYGHTFLSVSRYVYLPLLMFVQVPFVDYKLFAIACWMALVWLVRRSFYATVALTQPYAALMAASGFNDLPVLLLLTLAFVGVAGRRQRWAEWLALGVKQFANVLIAGYHLVRRDWRALGRTIGITTAFALPFLLWNPLAFLCEAVLYNKLSACVGYGTYIPWALNYSLYPLWAAAVFYVPVFAYLRSDRFPPGPPWVRSGLVRLWRLKWRFLAYAVIGASGVLVNLVTFTAAERGLGTTVPWVLGASSIAFCVALMWNFLWNYVWTFRDMRHRPLHHHLGLYGAIQIGALALNLGILDLWTSRVSTSSALWGQFLGVIVGSAWGFGANVRWNFRSAPERVRRDRRARPAP